MLHIEHICKKYVTGDLVQTALDDVSLSLRDNEFVAILGPSGSGKTTLLNVIGGLDRYDSGDLVINGVSTKQYRDRDWDSYRNHQIGFVFQSYNLIPHQSILANVELALTISGVSRSERRRRAREALVKVGLGEQVHKRPNQLSGGQMQRVAIARALINDPKILLADEPTGALDTETSLQVMELLKEVARDRLVVMVTHNPELAERYATRTVRLRDGRITDDSDPFLVDPAAREKPQHRTMGRSSMSFFTSLSLSFNNLRTKKGRTLLTSFAGSIGIIGIALILSLSTGVNEYITSIQKETMSSYPISIEAHSLDLSGFLSLGSQAADKEVTHAKDGVYADSRALEMASTFSSSVTENNLTAFKKYLDNPDSEIHQYLGENGVVYSYQTRFSVYTHDPDGTLVNTDGSTLNSGQSTGMMSQMSQMSQMSGYMSRRSNNFSELLPGQDGTLISPVVTDRYDVLYGRWPTAYDEVVFMLDRNNEVLSTDLYELGLLPTAEYKELLRKMDRGEEITLAENRWSYEDICRASFTLLPACDRYQKNKDGTFSEISDDDKSMEERLKQGIALKVVGVVRANSDDDNTALTEPIGYTRALTEYLMTHTEESAVVKAQEADKTVNVVSGLAFSPADDAARIADAVAYLKKLGVTEKARLCLSMLGSTGGTNAAASGTAGTAFSVTDAAESLPETTPSAGTTVPATGAAGTLSGDSSLPAGVTAPSTGTAVPSQELSEAELAELFDEYLKNPDDKAMLAFYEQYISAGSYEENRESFGAVNPDAPSAIRLYADSFEDKDRIADCIQAYNEEAAEADQISYTDYVALLMSSVTTIINVISYVLIAFVAVSLVVSSIMIGIITYISVLERTKEIGILRALGASRHNISQVFNAETFIIGLCAGLIGIGVTLLLLIPGNAVIHALTGLTTVNAVLPIPGAVILVVLSMVLTLIGGLIPSRKAARKDPVTALRTE